MDINSITVAGRLTSDPQTFTVGKSQKVTFGLANNRGKRDGEDVTNFFTVECWDKEAQFAADYLEKGAFVIITGELKLRKYKANDGTQKTAIEINVAPKGLQSVRTESGRQGGGGGGQQRQSRKPRHDDDEESEY